MGALLNWNAFRYKFDGREQEAFEKLAYALFCRKYGLAGGAPRRFNQWYIETDPVRVGEDYVGFQAKYYVSPTVNDKQRDELSDTVRKAHEKYPKLTVLQIYLANEFSDSKNSGIPKRQEEIEKVAAGCDIRIEWVLPSNFEILLNKEDAKDIKEHFFLDINDLRKNDDVKHHWDDTEKISKLSEKELRIADVRKFLLGRNSGLTYWNLIASGQIVRREIVDSLLDCTDEPGIYVLTGAGGEGKTTALMQLGSELVKKGKSVFFCNGRKPLPLPDPSMIEQGSVFLLDNALGYRSFIHMLEKIQELVNDKDVSFIMAARENEWNVMERNTPDYFGYYSGLVNKIPMRNVTKEEARLFASCIKKYLTTPKDEAQIREIFQKNSYGFLYASMLLSVSQKNTLDEIAKDIINNLQKISPDSLLVLAFAVMSEHCGTEFSQELFRKLLNQYKLNEKQVRYDLSKELVLNAGKYQTRHPVISELFYHEVTDSLDQDKLDDVIEKLVLLRMELYNHLSGYRKGAYWSGVKAVLQAVPLADSASQEHIFQRLLDDTKSNGPGDFDTLYDLIGNNITQSIFIRICYERDRLSTRNLRNWALQDLKEQPWDYTVPYSAAWFFRGVYDRISGDVKPDGFFWVNWAAFEKQYRGPGGYDQENSARWIYREACVNQNSPLYTLWLEWERLEAENGNIGDYEQENSARWVFREACINHNRWGAELWISWGRQEAERGNIGDYTQENSARWIYREACVNRNILESDIWEDWGRLEAENGNLGDYTHENSARWIFREACVNRNYSQQKIWLAWGRLEAENGNLGDYTHENSARWIFREACINRNFQGQDIWQDWGRLEAEKGEIGDYTQENSARWIYREACINRNFRGENIWLDWGRLEAEKGEIGDYTQENSARWIYREACINRNFQGEHIWLDWGRLEAEKGEIGDYTQENSARWIYREACINRHFQGESIWLDWGRLEAEKGEIGDYTQENSARWIYREACINRNFRGEHIWLNWGRLEAEKGEICDYNRENSARWIYREACINRNFQGENIWLNWGRLEAEKGEIGDYTQENSARWIYREACINRNLQGEHIWLNWGRLEVEKGEIGDYTQENSARWILSKGAHNNPNNSYELTATLAIIELKNGSVENARRVLEKNYLNNGGINGLLAILTIICGNGENGPLLEDLLIKLKNHRKNRLHALRYLYYCYLLQEDDVSAENTLEELRSQNSKTILSEEFRIHVNTFITLCRLANEGKPITDTEQKIDDFFIEEEIEADCQ